MLHSVTLRSPSDPALVMLTAVGKTYDQRTVLSDVNLQVRPGLRVGIVGPNGAGKSTLLRLLAGVESPDSGRITRADGVTAAWLPQQLPTLAGATLGTLLGEGARTVAELAGRQRVLEGRMATAAGANMEGLLAEYGEVCAAFEAAGGYALQSRLEAALDGLRLAHLDLTRPVDGLSGGEKSRAMLAGMLVQAPHLLCLDEPTNHLDASALEWLEDALMRQAGALLAVSHDRRFLERVSEEIWEVDPVQGHVKRYAGAYSTYRESRAVERLEWERAFAAQQEALRGLRADLRGKARHVGRNRPRTDGDKLGYNVRGVGVQRAVSRNVRMAQERIERIEADLVPLPPPPVRLHLPLEPPPGAPGILLWAEGVSLSRGGRVLIDDVSLSLPRDARLLVSGPNGAGKSSLLRLLHGALPPDRGQVTRTAGLRVARLAQEPEWPHPARSAQDLYGEAVGVPPDAATEALMRTGLLLLRDLRRPVCTLSLGQQRRLELVLLVAGRPQLLLLDEPQNHLDLDVMETFEEVLDAFAGAVVVVSHDRWFAARFRGQHLRMESGRLR